MKHHLVLLALSMSMAWCRHVVSSGTSGTSGTSGSSGTCVAWVRGGGGHLRVTLSSCDAGESREGDRVRVRAGKQGFLGDTNTPVISYSPDNEVTMGIHAMSTRTESLGGGINSGENSSPFRLFW